MSCRFPFILLAAAGLAAANTAIIPAPNKEKDGYDWLARHREAIETGKRIRPDVVLIGDSITHHWAGEPAGVHVRGEDSWNRLFEGMRPLNLGCGWDRTQNVLWRIEHGELDNIAPSTVVIHIGTNNTSTTENAEENTAEEIADGILKVCGKVREKLPDARILLMAVFPREEKPEHPRRLKIAEVNRLLARQAEAAGVRLIDIGPALLSGDGTLSREIMPDFCHPSAAGYRIWADALRPILREGDGH